jgi:hypothetical protein
LNPPGGSRSARGSRRPGLAAQHCKRKRSGGGHTAEATEGFLFGHEFNGFRVKQTLSANWQPEIIPAVFFRAANCKKEAVLVFYWKKIVYGGFKLGKANIYVIILK